MSHKNSSNLPKPVNTTTAQQSHTHQHSQAHQHVYYPTLAIEPGQKITFVLPSELFFESENVKDAKEFAMTPQPETLFIMQYCTQASSVSQGGIVLTGNQKEAGSVTSFGLVIAAGENNSGICVGDVVNVSSSTAVVQAGSPLDCIPHAGGNLRCVRTSEVLGKISTPWFDFSLELKPFEFLKQANSQRESLPRIPHGLARRL